MGNPKKMIKIMTVTTVVVAVLATLSGVTMMVNASWVNTPARRNNRDRRREAER